MATIELLATAANISSASCFPAKSLLKSKKEEISALGSPMAKRPSGALEVGTPFYQDGQLQVRVYWKNRGGTRGFRIHLAPCHVHPSAGGKEVL